MVDVFDLFTRPLKACFGIMDRSHNSPEWNYLETVKCILAKMKKNEKITVPS